MVLRRTLVVLFMMLSGLAVDGKDQGILSESNVSDDQVKVIESNKEPENEPESDKKGLGITLQTDWVSKYMFAGQDLLDDHAAWQPSIDLELWDTGFHINTWFSFAATSRHEIEEIYGEDTPEDLDEVDYSLYYETSDPSGNVDAEFGVIYYDCFRLWSDDADFWDWYVNLTLPKCPLEPHFYFSYGYPKRKEAGGEGWMACVGLTHSQDLCHIPGMDEENPVSLSLSSDLWYTGGEYLEEVDKCFSHVVFSGVLSVPLTEKMTFEPGVYYQISMEDTINPDNEWWTQLSLIYTW